jgi:tetratricopeptide (TPR) repeat protein
MIGNLSPVVQRERAPWLARVARLGDRYRIRIAGGVFGEEYTRLMNATKITFNRSIRGEMNMRCYEAAACGSLLFYDEENEEIREFFEDRVHCVLYNARNLEELIDHYLTHDEERARVVAAARERVAGFSFPRHLRRLEARLEELDLPNRRRSGSVSSLAVPSLSCGASPAALSVPELRKRQARQSAATVTRVCNSAAMAYLEEALEIEPNDDAACNDLAVVSFLVMGQITDMGERRRLLGLAFEHMHRAVTLRPNSAFYRLNLSLMSTDAGRWEAALDLAHQALGLLDSGDDDPGDLFCLAYPPGWTEYRVQYAGAFNAMRGTPEGFGLLRRCLLLHRGGMHFGQVAEEQCLAQQAMLGYRIAVAARPDLGSGRAALARVLAVAGQVEEALSHLESALETDPFLPEPPRLYTELLLRTDRHEEARRFVAARRTVLKALTPHTEPGERSTAVTDLDEVRDKLARLLASTTAAA